MSIGLSSYRTRFAALLDAISGDANNALFLVETYNTLYPDDDHNSKGRIGELLTNLRNKSVAI